MIEIGEGVGDRFQEATKYSREHQFSVDFVEPPESYKNYPNKRRIPLPKPVSQSDKNLDYALRTRRSIRSFSDKPLSVKQLSYLLWASTGVQRREKGFEFRTAPSAGALYPVETYLVINNVEDVQKGVYHYSIRDHALEELRTGDFSNVIAEAALDQSSCAEAGVVFIWTAIFNRSKWKYGQRAYRYVYLDAGHIAENLALTTTSLNLGSCQIAAFYDDEVNKIINVDGIYESTIYMSVVGNIKRE